MTQSLVCVCVSVCVCESALACVVLIFPSWCFELQIHVYYGRADGARFDLQIVLWN